MILKTIEGGALVQQVLYSNIRLQQEATLEERREKNAVRRGALNVCKDKKFGVAALIFQNFSEESYWATFSFRDDCLPASREEAGRQWAYFRAKLKKAGWDHVMYLKCLEHRHGDGRYHVHAVIRGAPPEVLLGCWIYGERQHCQVEPLELGRVLPHERGGRIHPGLAAYIIKERPDKLGQTQVQTSRGGCRLEPPSVNREFVADSYRLELPEGARLLEISTPVWNQYGAVQYMRFLRE